MARGPLGELGLLFTPTAMVIAQAAIGLPLVAGLSAAALQHVDPDFRVADAGARRLARPGLAGRSRSRRGCRCSPPAWPAFGALISEVGAAMMVGGNIAGETRVLTTAAVLEASRGEFALALALGLILLTVAFAVNLVLTTLQQRGRP